MAKRRSRTSTCPQCGDAFPAGRLACPHCGSDAQTGWSEGHEFGAFTEEDYEEVVADLRGEDDLGALRWRRRRRLVVVTGLLVVFLFVFWLVLSGSSNW